MYPIVPKFPFCQAWRRSLLLLSGFFSVNCRVGKRKTVYAKWTRNCPIPTAVTNILHIFVLINWFPVEYTEELFLLRHFLSQNVLMQVPLHYVLFSLKSFVLFHHFAANYRAYIDRQEDANQLRQSPLP